MEKELFDELIAACNEAIEHEKGNITLNTNTITLTDEEIETSQLLHRKFSMLPENGKQKAMEYLDELLQATV